MNGHALAATLLAAAALAAPMPPTKRLAQHIRRTTRPFPALLAMAVSGFLALTAAPTVVLALLIVSGTLVFRLRRLRRERSSRREGEALAAALEVLVGELTVGAHPTSAFAVAGAEAIGPVGRTLRAVATSAQLGADVAAGIRALTASSAVPAYWDRLAVFWKLASGQGLAMSGLIRAAHRDIVDRKRFADRMRAGLSGARATATILASMPALGVLLGQLVGADPVGFLFGGGSGGVLLVVGAALICVGIAWADHIVDGLAA